MIKPSADAAVAVMVRDSGPDRSVLTLCRKEDGSNTPLWVFPGGKVEHGESTICAAQRELYEETGVQGADAVLIDERLHPLTGKNIAYVLVQFKDGEATVCEPDHATLVEWTPVSELSAKFAGHLSPTVESYLKTGSCNQTLPG